MTDAREAVIGLFCIVMALTGVIASVPFLAAVHYYRLLRGKDA